MWFNTATILDSTTPTLKKKKKRLKLWGRKLHKSGNVFVERLAYLGSSYYIKTEVAKWANL
jgi:hypothetical protein